ncbi:hypothetical protein M1L60_36040 [Actinoplanes sp. TRM 88003]|uniref:Uncharacterized protein n=1 Tax=Paractinoplanes aksuensis TaxID=2939490 RepID=A0ABT1DYR1_9ACTN|nr:hypothetical protein [Actinoplanes aksuensis]MCO8276003.1 hypothetical protein [Actinoplanes aksuensis]
MFPYNDPQMMLDLHHQRAGELSRQAAARRLVREAGAGQARRFGKWPWRRAEEPARAAVAV